MSEGGTNEDWRVMVNLRDEEHTTRLTRALHERRVEQEIRRRLGRHLVVSAGSSHSDSRVFVYADTEAAAREAERAVGDVVARHGLDAESTVDRWHPVEQEWQDPSVPMPTTPGEQQAEYQHLLSREAAESRTSGVAEWEVTVELGSHRDAVDLADSLTGDGWPVVRRWRFLIVAARDRDEADELSRRIERDTPGRDVTTRARPGGGIAWSPGSPDHPTEQ